MIINSRGKAISQCLLITDPDEPLENMNWTFVIVSWRAISAWNPLNTEYGLLQGLKKSLVTLSHRFSLPRILASCLAPRAPNNCSSFHRVGVVNQVQEASKDTPVVRSHFVLLDQRIAPIIRAAFIR